MNAERCRKIQAIFVKAVQSEPAQREAVLSESCAGDSQLRAEVAKLLAQDAQVAADGFLASPIPPTIACDAPPGATRAIVPGQFAPPGYQILGELGRGGMGVVYKALQLSVNRLVALKMILAGVHATSGELDRFRKEAQAVGRLEHPNIVRLYECTDWQGSPYFSMEYVDGGNLAQKLNGTPQSFRSAAELVKILAQALQYAHQNGIVHRDLKPANILLQIAEGKLPIDNQPGNSSSKIDILNLQFAIPKITDFGLAKQLDSDAGRTQTGTILGTASYMAPEQAEGQSKNVGPTTDVYALGAILYELLTGQPPFKADSPLETLKEVVSADPVPVVRLQPKVPRNLETICMKCLEKERGRRYASAAALAEDLRRFLADETILARRASPAERLWRWSRRNPIVAGLATGLLVVIIASFIGVTWQWRRAESNLQQADVSLRQALGALHKLITVAEMELRLRSGMQPLRKKLIIETLEYYQQLIHEHKNDATVQLHLAANHHRLAIVTSEVGKLDDALIAYEQAGTLFEEFARKHPRDATIQNWLAANYLYVGLLRCARGETDAALRSHEQALRIWQDLITEESGRKNHYRRNVALTQWAIASALVVRSKFEEAEHYYRQASALQEQLLKEDPANDDFRERLADNDQSTGWVYHLRGQSNEALQYLTKARKHRERLVEADTRHIWRAHDLAKNDLWRGIVLHGQGKRDEAFSAFERARAVLEPLARENPEVTDFQRTLAEARLNIGKLQHDKGRHAEACESLEQAWKACQRLLADNPEVTQNRVILADSYAALGLAQQAQGMLHEAQASLKTAWEFWQKLVDDHPNIPAFKKGRDAVDRLRAK